MPQLSFYLPCLKEYLEMLSARPLIIVLKWAGLFFCSKMSLKLVCKVNVQRTRMCKSFRFKISGSKHPAL